MSDTIPLVSRRQKSINGLMSEVDKISDDGLLRLQERALYMAEVCPRYPSTTAEITSLAEWRNRHGKAADHQRDR